MLNRFQLWLLLIHLFSCHAFILNNVVQWRHDDCEISLVESIPWNLTYQEGSPIFPPTYLTWYDLLTSAEKSVYLSAFYWSLRGSDVGHEHPSAEPGETVFKLMEQLARKTDFRIAQSGISKPSNGTDIDILVQAGANVSYIDVDRLMGSGILHTKLWSIDSKHGYVGSANMDFRSLTQVKELGVSFFNCPDMAEDVNKIFGAYFLASGPKASLPLKFPPYLTTKYNHSNPLLIIANKKPISVYFTMSPPEFRPPGRSDDLEAILTIIGEAKKYIYISVMDYSPEVVYYDKRGSNFWPLIDDALRQAAVDRGIEVRLLISKWKYTPPTIDKYLASLHALNGIRKSSLRIRRFIVPAYDEFQRTLDHARVNHNKYMVTDNTVLIGTSNWSGDYFLYTGGVSFVSKDLPAFESSPRNHMKGAEASSLTIRGQVESIFMRDWNSEYSHEL